MEVFLRTPRQDGALKKKGKAVLNYSREEVKTTSGSCVGSGDLFGIHSGGNVGIHVWISVSDRRGCGGI